MDIHGGGIEAKQTMRGAVAMLLGCELSQTSVLHWCWYIAVAGGFEQVSEIWRPIFFLHQRNDM
jgi:hypothetical protein